VTGFEHTRWSSPTPAKKARHPAHTFVSQCGLVLVTKSFTLWPLNDEEPHALLRFLGQLNIQEPPLQTEEASESLFRRQETLAARSLVTTKIRSQLGTQAHTSRPVAGCSPRKLERTFPATNLSEMLVDYASATTLDASRFDAFSSLAKHSSAL
jgi:hypothetical protein